MEFTTMTAALGLALAVWAWHDASRARERAEHAGRRACRQLGVQLLDETVALERLGLARDETGQLKLSRWYRLEFSIDGAERYFGKVHLLGARVRRVQLELPEGLTIL